ncbi:MAG: ImmA/IrrE family metallo-endopeptidase [Desulfobacter sp.]|nr:MAG: ImmA/IrrE family metallo-endopeptidase [Desulfobacter sp.]
MGADHSISIRYGLAEHAAQELHKKYGIIFPEQIRLRDIAYAEKALVVEKSITSAAASLVRTKNKATIRISPGDREERQRFSIAHELGHLKLNHQNGKIKTVCSQKDMMSWYKKSIETEANYFASELILPTTMLEKLCDVEEVDFRPVKEIAKTFRSSLTATAIKFVRLNSEKCALVYSENGKIVWSYGSQDWDFFIQRGVPLDERTEAYEFFQRKELYDDPIETPADAWFNDKQGIGEVVEHSIGSKEFDFVLSLLWIRPTNDWQ